MILLFDMAFRFISVVALVSAQVTPNEIIEIGKEIYQAIENNQPVIDVATDWAGVVPSGIGDWTTLSNWHGPQRSEMFSVASKEGMLLTNFSWTFAWKYGGSYNGVGQYVTQAGIEVLDSYALLSERLDVNVTSANAMNYGTSANPIGGLDVTVSVTSSGFLRQVTKNCTMSLRGDGTSSLGACESGTLGSMLV